MQKPKDVADQPQHFLAVIGFQGNFTAKNLLKAVVREFTQVGDVYPNKKNLVKFYFTKLEAQTAADEGIALFTCANSLSAGKLYLRAKDLAAKASFDMFTLIGQHDPSSASLLLSLFQSCQSSLIMEQVLLKSQPDPLTSQLAAGLHQRHHFLKNDVRTNRTTSPLFKDITANLSN